VIGRSPFHLIWRSLVLIVVALSQPFRKSVLVGADCVIGWSDDTLDAYVSFSRQSDDYLESFDPFGVPTSEIFYHYRGVRGLVRAMWGYHRDGWTVLDARLLFADVIGR